MFGEPESNFIKFKLPLDKIFKTHSKQIVTYIFRKQKYKKYRKQFKIST
jgi:hypothetical protein